MSKLKITSEKLIAWRQISRLVYIIIFACVGALIIYSESGGITRSYEGFILLVLLLGLLFFLQRDYASISCPKCGESISKALSGATISELKKIAHCPFCSYELNKECS
jgi:hypothetical protein